MEQIKEKLKTYFESALVDDIIESGKYQLVKEGDILIDYGKNIRSMPIILSGNIKVMRQDEDGREILLYYLGSSESCAMAYTCCMESRQSEIKAIAEDNVELLAIPQKKLDEWLIKYPSWRSYIFSSFTQRFNEMLKSIDSIAFGKLDERLVSYLKNKIKITGKSSIQLTHNQIAEELGTTRVVISRLLKKLENDGKLLLYRNEIKLLKAFTD
jgi:CRP/FNR family transcriptional regulator